MMNSRLLSLYQYVGPLLLTPLAFWLWWKTYECNVTLTLVAWLIPILFAYIVPGIGTNVLKVWEFNTRFRLGHFRPQHGFVFGSATSMIAWICHIQIAENIFDALQTAFILASVLGFWNVVYDIKALKSGVLKVYNQPWADGKEEEAIAMDYAPIFFAGFGLVYGLAIGIAEFWYISGKWTIGKFLWFFPLVLLISIALPVGLYRYNSFKKHGHSGCKPVK